MRRIAIVLALAAAGCTPMQWVKQDAAPEQIVGDQQECRQRAWREATDRAWLYPPVSPVIGPGFAIWPSGSIVDPYGHQLLDEHRLAQFCMESKGYKLVPAPSTK